MPVVDESESLYVCVCFYRLLVSRGPVPGAGTSLRWSHGVSPGQGPWSCHSGGLCPPQTSQLPARLAYTLQWKRLVEFWRIIQCWVQHKYTVYNKTCVCVQGLGLGQLPRPCVWVWDTGNLRDWTVWWRSALRLAEWPTTTPQVTKLA